VGVSYFGIARALIAPFLRVWKARRASPSGYEGRYETREIVNALFYQNRTGCQWALLPHDLPPGSAVYYDICTSWADWRAAWG
jgi:transposase